LATLRGVARPVRAGDRGRFAGHARAGASFTVSADGVGRSRGQKCRPVSGSRKPQMSRHFEHAGSDFAQTPLAPGDIEAQRLIAGGSTLDRL
jgi:hypothetical protein